MSVFNSILLDLVSMLDALGLYAPVKIGALPPDNGLSVAYGTGTPDAVYVDRGLRYRLYVVFNGKHTNAQTVSDALGNAHIALARRTSFPPSDAYQILSISTIGSPSYLSREEGEQILYGSSLSIDVYIPN